MDVMYDQLIDIGLNTLGYLVAASLGVLVYSSVLKRKPSAATVESGALVERTVPTGPTPVEPQPTADLADVEFVNFRAPGSPAPAAGATSTRAAAPTAGTTRRDRAEIIRLAREMIKAQTPKETIQRSLPISEGELALLQNSNN